MPRSACVLLVSSLLLATSAGLASAAVTPVSRESALHLYTNFQPLSPPSTEAYQDEVFTSLSPYDSAIDNASVHFGSMSAKASQQSSVALNGEASATLDSFASFAGSSLGYNWSRSQFTYTFDVSDPESYSLTGLLSITTIIPVASRPMYGTVSLTGPGAAVNFQTSADNTPFTYSGTLTPGRYTLYLETYSQDFTGATATVDLSANLSLTPEPSSVLTLAAAPLLALRRRGRRRA